MSSRPVLMITTFVTQNSCHGRRKLGIRTRTVTRIEWALWAYFIAHGMNEGVERERRLRGRQLPGYPELGACGKRNDVEGRAATEKSWRGCGGSGGYSEKQLTKPDVLQCWPTFGEAIRGNVPRCIED